MSEEKKDKKEELKNIVKKTDTKKPVDLKPGEIVIDSEIVQGLISTVNKLKQDIGVIKGDELEEIPATQIKKARVHFYKGEVVTEVGTAWETADKFGESKMRLEIFIGKNKKEVDLKDYTESNPNAGFTDKLCLIKEIVTLDKGEEIFGWVDKVEVEYDSYRSKTVGRVANKVVTPVYDYIMEIPSEKEGKEPELVSVNPTALN